MKEGREEGIKEGIKISKLIGLKKLATNPFFGITVQELSEKTGYSVKEILESDKMPDVVGHKSYDIIDYLTLTQYQLDILNSIHEKEN